MVRHRWMHNWRLSYLKRKRRFKSIGSNPSPQYIQNVSNHQLIQYHFIGIYQYDGHIIFAAGLFCKYLWNFISMIFLCSVSCFYMYSLQCMHLNIIAPVCSSAAPLIFLLSVYINSDVQYPQAKNQTFWVIITWYYTDQFFHYVFYICYWKDFQMLKNCSDS